MFEVVTLMAEDVSEWVLLLSLTIRGRQRTMLSGSFMRHQAQLSVLILAQTSAAAVRHTEHFRAKKNHCQVKRQYLERRV